MVKKWKETSNRYIAFIDIMGFSNLVFRNSHESVKKKMKIFTENISRIESIYRDKISEDEEKIEDLIRTIVFSDSVLFISKDASKTSLESILIACQLLLPTSLESGIPLKGAISYGQITADFENSLFFGKGLIDAYKLEEELHFYGIALDHKVQKKLRILKLEKDYYCHKEKIPTKSGSITHEFIHWHHFFTMLFKEKDMFEMIEALYEDVSGAPRKYVDNTMEIYRKACT